MVVALGCETLCVTGSFYDMAAFFCFVLDLHLVRRHFLSSILGAVRTRTSLSFYIALVTKGYYFIGWLVSACRLGECGIRRRVKSWHCALSLALGACQRFWESEGGRRQ